jgi:hypothetical protein
VVVAVVQVEPQELAAPAQLISVPHLQRGNPEERMVVVAVQVE